MPAKQIEFGKEARVKALAGLEKLYRAVSVTLGPGGRNVLFRDSYGSPISTKDGVTVARRVVLKDPFEDAGAQLCKASANRAANAAGDGPQPLYSKVLTPQGFVEMGSLKVGDDVCGTNGSIQKVIGVFPKGLKQIFKVSFVDGREVECCEDHLWEVTTYFGRKKVSTTGELLAEGVLTSNDGYKRHRFFVQRSWAEFCPTNQSQLPLHPYLVGLLIGDGSLSGAGSVELSLGPNEGEIIEKIPLPPGLFLKTTYNEHKHYYRVKIQGTTVDGKSIKDLLEEIGLLGVLSGTKFIPKQYLYSSQDDRLELLRGLIDTDGHINIRGLSEYSTISSQLFYDVQELFRGLGKSIHSCLLERKKESSYSMTPIYRITELKGDKYGNAIEAIVPTDQYTEMQCIKVENPDNLYFTDNYILTHNTTTATVLTYAMVSEGVKHVDAGANSTAMRRGMDRCCADLTKLLEDQVQKVEKSDRELIEAVATISGNSEEVGKMVADAYLSTGEDAVVIIEASQRPETYLDHESGFSFDEGFEDSYYITNPGKQCVEYENPIILVTSRRIQQVQELAPFLDRVTKQMKDADGNDRPLIIVSATVEEQPRSLMVLNKTQGGRPWCSVRAPGFDAERRENLEDLAISIGGEFVPEESQIKLEQVDTAALGTCARIFITKEKTTIIGGGADPEKLKAHVETLKAQLEGDVNDEQKKRLEARIARLCQGIAVIKIFAPTIEDLRERAYRYEDSILAVKAALADGVVPGGGTALFKCADKCSNYPENPDERIGYELVKKAVCMPMQVILQNAGYWSQDKGLDQFKGYIKDGEWADTYWFGYNAHNGEFCDLLESHILDPMKVTRIALEAAVSTAALYLNTECMIVEDPEDLMPQQSMMPSM